MACQELEQKEDLGLSAGLSVARSSGDEWKAGLAGTGQERPWMWELALPLAGWVASFQLPSLFELKCLPTTA